jgi:hypothetical protein
MRVQTFETSGDAFWTDDYGVYRWCKDFVTRPGTYRVVGLLRVSDLMRMCARDGIEWPTCVVDDFGSLVKVPA